MQILHVITGLSVGGAEMMLYKLLGNIDRVRWRPTVVSLLVPGPLAGKLRDLEVPVLSLGMQRGLPDPRALLRLIKIVRETQPDIVQTWMYHADLLGGLAVRRVGRIPVIWGLRQSNFSASVSSRRTIAIAKACALLSHVIPSRIVCCSEEVRRVHEQMGYDDSKMCVIPNGFLVDRFVPNPIYRSEVRDEIGLTEDAKVVGLVARFDPMKDHFSFIRAAGQILKGLPETRFVMCGEGISWDNTPLAKWIFDEGIQRAFTLLGPRDDLHRVYPAFDVYVSSSAFGEGFPNVLGEAMASGIPCVATDVGDSALIVGDTGRIVPPRNPGALAMALIDLLELSRFDLDRARQAARNRIVDLFTIQRIAPRFEAAYSEVIEDAGRADRERRMGGRH